MKFLSRLGQLILKGAQIITGLGPLFPQQAPALGKVSDTLDQIVAIIVNVEAFGQVLGHAGPDKLKAAAPLVAQILLQSDLLAGKKIDDPVLFHAGATKIADGVADVLNSLKDNAVETTPIS